MPLQGPCANPNCKDQHNSSGQWSYVPESIRQECGLEVGANHCKKADCLRWCQKKDERKKPGRPSKKQRDEEDGLPLGRPLQIERSLPRPPIIESIIQIWAVR